ncbi:hypothetical protein AB4584_23455 [Vibrio splendidus]
MTHADVTQHLYRFWVEAYHQDMHCLKESAPSSLVTQAQSELIHESILERLHEVRVYAETSGEHRLAQSIDDACTKMYLFNEAPCKELTQ